MCGHVKVSLDKYIVTKKTTYRPPDEVLVLSSVTVIVDGWFNEGGVLKLLHISHFSALMSL